jgi:hypothetical protein
MLVTIPTELSVDPIPTDESAIPTKVDPGV